MTSLTVSTQEWTLISRLINSIRRTDFTAKTLTWTFIIILSQQDKTDKQTKPTRQKVLEFWYRSHLKPQSKGLRTPAPTRCGALRLLHTIPLFSIQSCTPAGTIQVYFVRAIHLHQLVLTSLGNKRTNSRIRKINYYLL